MTGNFMRTCAQSPRTNHFITPSEIPPDVRLRISKMSVSVEADPFEAALTRNINLMRDEHSESVKREELAQEMYKETTRMQGVWTIRLEIPGIDRQTRQRD